MKILTAKSALVLATIFSLVSCGSSTSVTASYKNPSMEGKTLDYKKIFVAALTPNIATKQKVETSIAESITAQGYTAVKSTDVFLPGSQNSQSDSNVALQAIRETGSDAILTVSMVNKETETRYVPGSSYPVSTYPYYGSFGGYWGASYTMYHDPGYYTTDKTYFLETNLYDIASEKLIWSAQSETLNPSDLDDFLNGYKKSIQKQLVKDGLGKEKAK